MTRFDAFDRLRTLTILHPGPLAPYLIGVAPASGGGLLRVYHSAHDRNGLSADRLDRRGTLLRTTYITHDPVQVITGSVGVGGDGAGGLVVAYNVESHFGPPSLRLHLLDTSGRSHGIDFALSPETALPRRLNLNPAIAAGLNRFAVAWGADEDLETGGRMSRVFAKVFSNTGTPLTPTIEVASRLTPRAFDPAGLLVIGLAFDREANLLVVWSATREPGAADRYDEVARLFDSAGNPLGPPFFVNDPREGGQICGRVGVDDRGQWTFIWFGDGPQGCEIYARQFRRFEEDPGSPRRS